MVYLWLTLPDGLVYPRVTLPDGLVQWWRTYGTVPEMALGALSVGTQAITTGQSSRNRTKSTKSSCSLKQLKRFCSQRYFKASLHWLIETAGKVRWC
ncbi:hypothetical protein GDO81_020578 [Engystomops pustulosus]|uniref:Uncharacterized protein n=1 Tax=Engystomops pustulosus TaxID=76066 RepID=A0AAV6YRV1_ENGPU|nr:hypothetical protein GDO81_020578 [Engystomops pustulosus]